jgi:hypothetical protein
MAVVLAASLTSAGVVSGAALFHKGGLGECSGCHGKSADQKTQGAFSNNSSNSITMLKRSDPGSTCLTCHEAPRGTLRPEGYYIATNAKDMPPGVPPAQLTPGGDFGWLKKNYPASDGSSHGHNILAADFNYAETDGVTAPGGTYPAAGFTCISCHDPHGNYRRSASGAITATGLPIIASGSYSDSPDPGAAGTVGTYRLLAGKGYQPKYLPKADYAFKADPPAAVAPTSYNRAESSSDSRVAYGSGMSEWCINCHVIPHGDSVGHPAGNGVKMSGEIASNYDAYIVTGNLNGTARTSYTSLVPFEMGTNDYAILKGAASSNGFNRTGPTGNANVMCLTCHRAHASGWDFMSRWDMRARFLVSNGRYPGIDGEFKEINSRGRTVAEIQKSYYDRPARVFGYQQMSLCNKCHPKD